MKGFTIDSTGLDLTQGDGVVATDGTTYGDQMTGTLKAYIDASEDTLDIAGSPHPFRTAAGTSLTIPDNAIVTNVRLDVTTLLSSGGAATVALGIEAANDVKLATAFNAAPFSGGISLEAVMIKTTAAQTLDLTVAAADLGVTGRIVAFIDYVISE